MDNITRRSAIRGAVGGIAVGFVAGCLGDDDDDGGDDGGDASPEDVAVDWVEPADNVDGEGDIVDETGADEVVIENGPTGQDGNYIMEPGIVRVDTGADVTWDWVSSGHTVTEVPGEGATITDWEDHDDTEGEGFEYTTSFDESGVVLYECRPHRAQNQRGAIIVE